MERKKLTFLFPRWHHLHNHLKWVHRVSPSILAKHPLIVCVCGGGHEPSQAPPVMCVCVCVPLDTCAHGETGLKCPAPHGD